ncbi:MAG: NAD-dependent epimerase/dehydratase family protein [Melioribacteraceae bacterium]|nr:NAD-dependent epimerase/dehydratase family protein [Melioribacteraceae bacterium]
MENKIISVVTGGTGFVGSNLVDLLLEKGHEVRCIVRKTSSLKWLKDKPVKLYDCGLLDKEPLKEVLENADFLYHVAGVVKAKKPEGYTKGNVDTTRVLLETCLDVNPKIKRVVIISSQTACGPSIGGHTCDEETLPHPITNYGRSKWQQEQLVAKYMDKLAITVCRPPAVYGQRDTDIFLVFQAFSRRIMTLIGFDKKKVSLINVKDLARGIFLSSQSEKAKGETYFITSSEFYDWYQVGAAMAKVMNKKAVKIKIPHSVVYFLASLSQFFAMFKKEATIFNIEKARDMVQTHWTCNGEKAEKDFGFRQEISLEEGIKQTVAWYKEQKWL